MCTMAICLLFGSHLEKREKNEANKKSKEKWSGSQFNGIYKSQKYITWNAKFAAQFGTSPRTTE